MYINVDCAAGEDYEEQIYIKYVEQLNYRFVSMFYIDSTTARFCFETPIKK